MTAAKLIARFWSFVESVLTTQKPVRSIYTFAEFDFTAARLVRGLLKFEDSILAA